MELRRPSLALVTTLAAASAGCSEPAGPRSDAGLPDAGPARTYTAPACVGVPPAPTPACMPLASDYSPGADDTWGACISDDDTYHRVQPTIGALQRVAAFEAIGALLFDPTKDPSPEDFLAARLLYQQDEGLDSRMVRRYDPHFTAPLGTDCTQPGVPAAQPDYCVGPSTLQPLILASFEAGIVGGSDEPPRVHAARIEAAILWFFYVSIYKEGLTCTTTAKDCDSAYAKYTGGMTTRTDPPIGLSRYVASVDPLAHDRAWDGALALRCWRDLDPAVPAGDLTMRELARTQFDRAVLDGLVSLLRARLVRLCSAQSAELGYHFATVQVLADMVDRALTAADPAAAATLRTEVSRASVDAVDVAAAVSALDAVFVCP